MTSQHIDAMKKLFEYLEDPGATNSGLELASASNGELAWVCASAAASEEKEVVGGDTELTKKSPCYQEFYNIGERCIAVALKYV